ncbi:protein Shroom1 [Sardina pilchardus]|uniref:protein Shroom1 n=1 Tax=Sardina pilchardus TaxID=27697 RepID=UPI002E0DF963
MDSFSFPLERMSNLDMHPLSFPISRLSPAKSSSSIDQYTHHHGKGDSAYSSFSGGSNAPDLSSPFFPDDFHAHGFQYADFKYMNSTLNLAGEAEPKSMDQLYRSMEVLTRQCNQEDGSHCSNGNQQCSKKQMSPTMSLPPPPPPPPPPPARLESLVTVRNMENLLSRQGPEGQTADRSRQRAYTSPAPPPPFLPNIPGSVPDSAFSLPGAQTIQGDPVNRDASAQQKSANTLSRLAQMYPSLAAEHDSQPAGQQVHGAQGDAQRKRAHSAYAALPPAPLRSADSRPQPPPPSPPSAINGSIQHKGHFYFVTGVCKTEGPPGTKPVAHVSDNSGVDSRKPVEKERFHGPDGGVQRTTNHRRNSYDALGEREHFPRAQELSVRKQDADGYLDNALLGSKHAPHIPDAQEPGQRLLGREITGRHHSSAHPIFYCGPEESVPHVQPSVPQPPPIPPPVADPSMHTEKQEEQARKVRKQPLDVVPREKISKENTPLLYHLTGANRMALMNKFKNDSDSGMSCRNPERNSGAPQQPEKERANPKEVKGASVCSDQCEDSKMTPVDTNLDNSYPTLDDSFKKYYKEKLKDVQSRVLRETSFKRRDLQPHKTKQKREQQQPVLQVFTSAQDPLYTVDKPSRPWSQHQSQVSDTKSRNDNPREKTWERGTIGGESEKTVGKEKERKVAQENESHSVDIRVEETRKDVGVEESRKDVRSEEIKKVPKVAQPQVPRIGGRKRLTQEQKKMCFSEPEKLHKLLDAPTHKPSHSLGNEAECLLTDDDLGDQGLVAARRKLFETRGRALSASSLSKTTLKHLQHKALVAYMERKTGQKATETQQPCPQVPSQRHSTAGRPHHGNGGSKKRLHRPLSAGRILDSSSSSIRYAQFGSTSSGEHSRQSSWKDVPSASPSKAASVESLLDQPELSGFYRARSKSTPHALQDSISISDASSTDSSSTLRGDVNTVAGVSQTAAVAAVVAEERRRVVAPRGKSMEELGVSKVIRPACLSRSSEQLDQLRTSGSGRMPGSANPGSYQSREKRSVAAVSDGVQPGEWTRRWTGHQEGWAQATQVDIRHSRGDSTSSAGSLPGGAGAQHDLAQSSGLVSTGTETKPRGYSVEGKPLSSLYQTEAPVPPRMKEWSEMKQPGSCHEVALSHGVTTDPSLWPSAPGVDDDDDDEDDDDGEEEDGRSSPFNTMGTETMLSSVRLSQSESPRATPTAEANASVGEKLEGEREEEREEESQQEREMKDREQEVASAGGNQTEEPERNAPPPPPPPQQQQQHQQQQKTQWAALVEEVASADQFLAVLLRPVANRKTALMLMEQLLSEDTLLMEEHYKKKQEEGRASGLEEKQQQQQQQQQEEEKRAQRASAVEEHPGLSSRPSEEVCSEPQQNGAASLSGADVNEKKRQLLACVEERLSALGEQRSSLQEEEEENGARGAATLALVAERCLPTEQERYSLFIGDLERVVSLLLCLSARLARVQNALSAVDEHTDEEEKQSLDNRHHLLCKQRDDAKDLKDNLDRRERVVSTFLSKHLTAAELQDYRRFVQTKASLLIRLKDLDERQRLGEEQRDALSNSLPP